MRLCVTTVVHPANVDLFRERCLIEVLVMASLMLHEHSHFFSGYSFSTPRGKALSDDLEGSNHGASSGSY